MPRLASAEAILATREYARRVTPTCIAVLTEEMRRQNRKPGEVCVAAGVNKNALYKVRDGGGLKVETLAALARALDVPLSEIAFRVERRMAA